MGLGMSAHVAVCSRCWSCVAPLAGVWGSSLPRKPIVSGAALHGIRKPGGDLQADFRNLRIIPQAQVCNQLLQQWGENALWRKTAFFKLLNAS